MGSRDTGETYSADQPGSDAPIAARAQEMAHVGTLAWDVATRRVLWSPELCRIHDLPVAPYESTIDDYLSRLQADDRVYAAQLFEQARSDQKPFEFEARVTLPDGTMRILGHRGLVQLDKHGHPKRVLVACQDITEQKRSQQLAMGQHDILVGIAAQHPLSESLDRIARLHESLNPGALCSILLLDDEGRHVLHGAAPSLPQAYSALLNGLEIGDQRGSCGTAAWRRERVVVGDIETHPYWADYKALALAHGLRACWSTPVLGSDGRVLGTFAVYFNEPREPRLDELESIDRMVPIAGVAIESAKLIERLRVRDRFFDMSLELFCIVDPVADRLIQFNPSLQRLTGYDADELTNRSYRELFLEEKGEHARWGGPALHGATRSIREFVSRCFCKDGSERILEWVSFAAPDGLLYAVARDITQRRAVEDKLAYASSHDAITGLKHHLLFEHHLADILRDEPSLLSVMVIGLDRFQVVNESIGHIAADEVLKRLAVRLQTALPEQAFMSRIAGDQFVIALPEVEPALARELAERMRAVVAGPMESADYRLMLTASVGVSHYPHHGRTSEDLLRRAEAAMIQAKRDGRDQLAELSVAQMVELEDRVLLGSRLQDAIKRRELELYYQPQHTANGLRLIGFEALLRWNCTQFGPLPPARFIPIAEALGLMPEIGVWVLDTACRQARAWLELGHRDFIIAVNVSAQQLMRSGLAESVADMLQRHGIPPSMLEIEMTESALMEDVTRTRDTLGGLKRLGTRLSLDDFGTGYSSLSYLRQFPIDKLKIDKSFINGLPLDLKDVAISTTIIALGHQLGMEVAAEGVETQAQATLLAKMGCDVLQGHFLAPALSAREAQVYFGAIHYGAA
ncbi:bifunctional diguanylate cyclase/phosphodiesterase [Dyella silvae]|uniref:bifunctional diguanylate cyclase/phosphodiesterase n=1 Tax=Dyella silvae TaxID=2994424 RepID=UPI00226565F7|nr:EAL domain-containing protein [Dyella silvae]